MAENDLNERQTTQIVAEPAQISAEPTQKKSGHGCAKLFFLVAVAFAVAAVILSAVIFCVFMMKFPKTVATENGKIVYEYYYGLGKVKTETEYDKNDRMIKKTAYDDEGMLLSYSNYFYDENGVLTEEQEYSFGELSSIKKYDVDGTVVREDKYSLDKLYETCEYEYDKKGRLIREYEYDENGKLQGRREYEYEEGTDRRRWDYYDASGKLTDSRDYYSLP